MPLYEAENPDVQYAYLTIAGFFDAYALAPARAYTRRMLKTADSHRYWKGDPSAALHFLQKLEGLVMAALTLHREEAVRPAALVALTEGEVPSVTDYRQYCGWHYKRDPWYFFPRSLSRAEYADPYRVFARLAAVGGRKKWKALLRNLQFYTLSTSSLNGSGELTLSTLQLYLRFTKLIEAAHLIEVRAMAEIGGEPRPKWKGPHPTPADDLNDANTTA